MVFSVPFEALYLSLVAFLYKLLKYTTIQKSIRYSEPICQFNLTVQSQFSYTITGINDIFKYIKIERRYLKF